MSNKLIQVWITKHALTKGIQERQVVVCAEVCLNMVSTVNGGGLPEVYHGEGVHWHRTREGAVLRAEEMRNRKIATLKKSLLRLENKTFD